MNLSGLRDYQIIHCQRLLSSLQRTGAALDASDTGTGKTYVALTICRELGIIPFVVGPKSARAGWEKASQIVGVDIEYVNYEKLRGRRVTAPDGTRLPAESEWTKEVPWGKGSFLRWKNSYAVVIFDECHRCGGATSLNSKLMIAAKRQSQLVLALSATAADDPRQMKALGYTLGLHNLSKKGSRTCPDYMSWLLRHGCSPGTFGGFDFTTNSERQQKAFRRLNTEIFPHHGSRMRKAEIPGFPQTTVDVLLLDDETGKAAEAAEELHNLDQDKPSSLEDVLRCRQELELLKVPCFVDLAEDYALTSKVVIFVNFTESLVQLFEALKKKFGDDQVGVISGAQTGVAGETQRFRYLELFQQNRLTALVCNIQAGGESANMHDPTGQVERTALISPCESGRQFKQVLGRVHRDGGARSLQLVTYFRGTHEETVADRLRQKGMNIDLLNDADFFI